MIYKKIDRGSLDALPNGLDVFTMPVTNVAVEKAYEREFLTLNPINLAPYNYKIHTSSSWLDPRSVRIVTKFRASKEDSGGKFTNLLPSDNINVINGLGASWIRNLRVTMSGQTIFDSNNLYSYKSDFDNLTGFSEDAKKSSMNTFGYYYDDRGKTDAHKIYDFKNFDVVDKTDGTKVTGTVKVPMHVGRRAWESRRDLFVNGNEVEMSSTLYADVFQQPLFIPSNMEIDIEIHPQEDKFLVIAPDYMKTDHEKSKSIKLTITSVRMYATFYDLHPAVALEIEKKMAAGEPLKYPMRRTEMKQVFYDFQKDFANTQVFSNYIPRNFYVVFVKKEDYNGRWDTDPMYYQHMDLKSIEMHAGNVRVPHVPFEMDWDKNLYIRGFEHLHRTLGLTGGNIDCGINREMFADGYTLWAFNLTSSLQDDETFDFVREGPTMMNLRFNKRIPTGGVLAICMGQWDSIMYIDQTRTVRTDLSA